MPCPALIVTRRVRKKYVFFKTMFCKRSKLSDSAIRIRMAKCLLTNSKTLEKVKVTIVTIRIAITNVIKQTTTTRNHSEQASSSRIVFGVSTHVLCQAIDTLGENCDLNIGRTVVLIALLEFPNDFCFCFFRDCHTSILLILSRSSEPPPVLWRSELLQSHSNRLCSFWVQYGHIQLHKHRYERHFSIESSPDDTDWTICAKKRNAGVASFETLNHRRTGLAPGSPFFHNAQFFGKPWLSGRQFLQRNSQFVLFHSQFCRLLTVLGFLYLSGQVHRLHLMAWCWLR